MRRWAWPALLALCALGGLTARLWNVDFDARQHLHPDERFWSLTSAAMDRTAAPAPHGTVAGPLLDWLDGDRSPASVYRATPSFQYGPITLALARGASAWLHDGVVHDDQPATLIAKAFDAVGVDLLDESGHPRFDDAYQVDLLGRVLGAFIDTITIVVIGLIGRRLAGRRVGVLAAGLYATSVLAIQHAHYLGAEPLVGLMAACTVLATLHMDRSADLRAWPRALLAGMCAGAAVAAKLTGLPVAALPIAVCAWLVVRHRRRADLARSAAVLAGAAAAFRVLNPGAFNGLGLTLSSRFRADLDLSLTTPDRDFPPAVQWARRSGVVDGVRWLLQFTIGPGVFLAAVVGGVVLWRRRARVGRCETAVLFGAVLLTCAVVMRSFAFTGRYFMPMLPAVCVLAGVGVHTLWTARPSWPRGVLAARVTAAALVGPAVLWGAAFVHGVYGHTNTRVAASRWIEHHVPKGSVLSVEEWDDALPLRLPGIDRGDWESESLALWDTDTVAKIDHLATQLERLDYVVESSPRVWAAVTRIPARYPATIGFFDALDAGTLGFERVATFSSGMWGSADGGAEEAFTVYDHPEVRIWKKVRPLDHDALLSALHPWSAATAVHVTPQQAAANGLVLFPYEQAQMDRAGTYDDAFDTTSSPWWHLTGWLALLVLSSAAAFVLFLPLLRRLPDAGAGAAPLLGLAVPAIGLFVAVTWLHVVFSRGLVIAVYLAWLGAAAIAARRRWTDVVGVWRQRRRTIVTAIALAVGAFVAMVLLRAANPDLWHPYRAGEKPFELTMLTEVLRTRTLPPYDAWSAGGSLNYYYGAFLMLSLPARLLRTSPAVVMNLALAVFGAATASAAYCLGAAVRARTHRRSSRDLRRAGVLAAAFVLVLPNPRAVIDAVHWLTTGAGTFDWWAPSRVLTNSFGITEFPAWSFLFADAHAHVMDLAVLLTVMTLALTWYLALVHRRRSLVLALMVGVLVGLVRATNTWDFPLAVATAVAVPAAVAVRTRRWRVCVRDTLVVAAGIVLLWLPYTQRMEVYDAGTDDVVHRTRWPEWAAHWGVFAVCTLIAVLPVARRWMARRPYDATAAAVIGGGLVLLLHDRSVQVTCALLAVAAATAALATGSRRGVSRLGLGAIATGWIVIAAIEEVSVKNDIDRLNTVFKGWYQAWLLLAVGCAVCLAAAAPVVARTALRITVAAALVFAWAAVPARVDQRTSAGGWTLDGEDSMVAADRPIIDWLRANVHGLVTVAEAPGDDYTWTGRIATYTGLPTVIGWPFHERQQGRPYGPLIDQRLADMTTLYTTEDATEVDRILATYAVRYVVFGVSEQEMDGVVPNGSTLLAANCVTEVFRAAASFLAEVDPACLSSVPLP